MGISNYTWRTERFFFFSRNGPEKQQSILVSQKENYTVLSLLVSRLSNTNSVIFQQIGQKISLKEQMTWAAEKCTQPSSDPNPTYSQESVLTFFFKFLRFRANLFYPNISLHRYSKYHLH